MNNRLLYENIFKKEEEEELKKWFLNKGKMEFDILTCIVGGKIRVEHNLGGAMW